MDFNNTNMNDGSSYIIACLGPKKFTVEIALTSTLGDLTSKINELFSIAKNGQKIIFKGKLLRGIDSTLESFGIQIGDCVMVLGKVVRTERDLLLQELAKTEKCYNDSRTKVENIIYDITSIQGNLLHTESNQLILKESMKKLLTANEELMKLIENLDGMHIKIDYSDVRGKRKSIVQNIQKLMDKVDKDYNSFRSYLTL